MPEEGLPLLRAERYRAFLRVPRLKTYLVRFIGPHTNNGCCRRPAECICYSREDHSFIKARHFCVRILSPKPQRDFARSRSFCGRLRSTRAPIFLCMRRIRSTRTIARGSKTNQRCHQQTTHIKSADAYKPRKTCTTLFGMRTVLVWT